MQELIIYNENQVIIQANEKIYQDTQANFLEDYGKKLSYKAIDYNRDTQACWLNGEAFQPYPNEVCEDILNSIDTLIAKKVEREEPIPFTLSELKAQKIISLKKIRDTLEIEPVTYNGSSYDYDSKARERISAAIVALDVQGADASIDWTTADNADVRVTANDLRMVIAAVAQRSNALHVAYREAKDKVEQAITVAEVEAVTLDA